jgi:hypothetical protein
VGTAPREAREARPATDDDWIALESELGEALGRIRVLEAELSRYQDRAARWTRLRGSALGRFARRVRRARVALGRRVRRLLERR